MKEFLMAGCLNYVQLLFSKKFITMKYVMSEKSYFIISWLHILRLFSFLMSSNKYLISLSCVSIKHEHLMSCCLWILIMYFFHHIPTLSQEFTSKNTSILLFNTTSAFLLPFCWLLNSQKYTSDAYVGGSAEQWTLKLRFEHWMILCTKYLLVIIVVMNVKKVKYNNVVQKNLK